MPPKPPLVVDLSWQEGLRFAGRAGERELILDGDGNAGVSPVQALGFALASCMATDVAHILTRGRLPLKGLRAHLVAERAPEDPHRFVKVDLRFVIIGEVPGEKVEHAIALSREKYCSVWHSLRQDIEFTTSFELATA